MEDPKIKREKDQVDKEIDSFKDLILRIERQRHKMPHLEILETLVKAIHSTLKDCIEDRLTYITSGVPVAVAVSQISVLRVAIKELFGFVYNVISNLSEVRRELYFLCDFFLECYETQKNYIIFISDEIAVQPFDHILKLLGFDTVYPEFWDRMRNRNFHFVMVISDLAKMDASLDWSIVLHEMAHIVCKERDIDNKYLQGTSILDALLAVQTDVPPFLLVLPQKKLRTAEYLADSLVTQCFGMIYGWRFLRSYFPMREFFEPALDHPPPDARIRKMSTLINDELKLTQNAKFLLANLESLVGKNEIETRDEPEEVNVDDIVQGVFDEVKHYSKHMLTYEYVKNSIFRSAWAQMTEKKKDNAIFQSKNFDQFLQELKADLLSGRPIIVDPSTLYFIATFNLAPEEIEKLDMEKSRLIRELIADCIRLYAIQAKYANEVKTIK